jgi:hypothetical protein
MDLSAEECAREIRAQLDTHRLVLCGEPVEGMWDGTPSEALRSLAGRFAARFAERNPGFNYTTFIRSCGFTD